MENENKPIEEKVEEVKEAQTEEKVSPIEALKKMCGKNCQCGEKCCTIWNKNKKMIVAAIILVIVVAGGFALKKYWQEKVDVGSEAVKVKMEKLVKENGASVKEVVKDGNFYKVTLSFNGQEQPVYVTKDGKKLIQSLISFEEIEKQQELAKKQEEENNKPVPKSDKPAVDLYVMSFCPYGNKAEDTLKPVYDLLKNKVDFNFHYIVSVSGDSIQSLHGEKEVVQNEREACVLKNYGKDKWFSFVSYVNSKCGSDGSCWEAGAKSLGINTAKITACVTADGLDLMKADEKISKEANASGSPTLKINGANSKAVYQYGNPESYKQAICDAFNTTPAECSKKLAAVSGASASAQTEAQGGSCGN